MPRIPVTISMQQQRGAVLVVSLLLLLVMTMLALGASQSTRLQERMSASMRDRDLADMPWELLRDGVSRPFALAARALPLFAVTLSPAGHILGSTMVHIARPEGSILYTGDFKLRPCLTAEPAAPEPADVLLMESTYGLPFFRFPKREVVIEELVERVTTAFRTGRQPIVMGYSLGKAQEITRILTDAGFPVTVHGAVYAMNQICEQRGVARGNATHAARHR